MGKPQCRQSTRLLLQSSELAPHPLTRVRPLPLWFGGGTHMLAGEGVGGPNSNELQLLYICTLWWKLYLINNAPIYSRSRRDRRCNFLEKRNFSQTFVNFWFGAGEDGVPAVDPLAAAHVQAGGQAQSQVHSHAQADAGDGLQGMGT